MIDIDTQVLLCNLRETHCAEYQRFQADYLMQHRNGSIPLGMQQEEFILSRMAALLAACARTFREKDIARRVCKVAQLFCKERCAALKKKRYPTGFEQLDEALDGGFVAGVHYIGAISSLGKSTLALQMADQMAANNIPVVYMSLEMSREDITAKLVSMHTFADVGGRFAKTATELTGSQLDKFSDADWAAVGEAVSALTSHRANITICDACVHGMSVDDISNYMQEYIKAYDVAPVLIIDYLQILKASKGMERYTDKQAVDHNVAEFRTLAATYNVPVIVISAFNRESYDSQVSLKSYKDSGNIEYSSDTLIGLQLQGAGSPGFDAIAAKVAYPRKVELVILKQRYGSSSAKIGYDFYTKYNYFEEQKQGNCGNRSSGYKSRYVY